MNFHVVQDTHRRWSQFPSSVVYISAREVLFAQEEFGPSKQWPTIFCDS